jgi:hypothetical protein
LSVPFNSLEFFEPLNSTIAMPSDHPQTPQSPSSTSFSAADLPTKQATSPRNIHSLPTPAHSINGSMSSLTSDNTEAVSHDDPSNKRKRDIEDTGDREQKKVHVEHSRLSIEDLHLDVGEKYLLCRTRKAPFFLNDLPFAPWSCIPENAPSSPAHHLQKYLVNTDLMRSPPCS